MIIIEYVFLGLYGIITGVDKLFSVLFGPSRFLVYAFVVFMLALPAIQKTILWQKYKAFVEDTAYRLNYGNLLKNESWFMVHNYNNILQYAISRRDWGAVKKLKRLDKEELYEYMLEYARVGDKAIKQIYRIR